MTDAAGLLYLKILDSDKLDDAIVRAAIDLDVAIDSDDKIRIKKAAYALLLLLDDKYELRISSA
jgi:hypothetical protein